MNSILIKNQLFNYTIKHKSISSIRLRLISKTKIQISCPYFTPEFLIKKFIQQNTDWIIKHSQKIIPKKSILNLQKINILDNEYQIQWFKTQKDSVVIFEDEQKIYSNLKLFSENHAKKTLEDKIRPFALRLIKKELSKLSDEYAFKYNHVTVRNQSSRYGSCSSSGNLNFNWQIIFFPYPQFRHILLHELTHLKIKNHSKVFWDQLIVYDPKCKFHNTWLRKEGTKLFLF